LNGWSQYRYGLEGMTALDKTGYKDEVILSLGAEKFITSLNMVLRAGYTWNTLPETNFNSTYDLNRFSAGVGLLASGSLSLDAAYSYAFWGMQGSGLTLDNREHRTLLTFAYRY
jgi:long-subunit fatty acid transport protein